MEKVVVSIIVPGYNHSEYLKQRLDSVFNQTFRDFEVILLDDHSDDDSTQILAEYSKHPKVSQFIINEVNSGSTFKQWQKGINLAKGKYIWIAESDDYADIQFLEKLINVYKKDDDISLVFSGSNFLNAENKEINYKKFATLKYKTSFIKNGKREIKDELIFHNSICNASSILFKAESLQNSNISNFTFCGDWKIAIDIIYDQKFYFLAEKLNYCRIQPNGVTNTTTTIEREKRRFREYITVMKYGLKKIDHSPILWRRRHRWIISEWIEQTNKIDTKTGFLFPPFPVELLIFFYFYLFTYYFKVVVFRLFAEKKE